jgi:serine/threonine protein kinase
MIADFGLTLFRERDPDLKENSGFEWEFGSSTYRAPECDKAGMKVGRAGDVWSLGCILAEVITFVFTGLEGVLAFMEHRKADTRERQMPGNQRMRDWFHDGEHVKPQVTDWFQCLVDTTNKDLFVAEFVCLLEKILQSIPDDRLKISDIESEFEDILRKEATRLDAGISTTNVTSGVIRVAGGARFNIEMVTPERKNTEFVSTLYGESFPTERITTGSKTTESTLVPPLNPRNMEEYLVNGNEAISHFVQQSSLDDPISAPYEDSLFGGLRLMMPWGWAKQLVAPSSVENFSVRRRRASNTEVAELLASHHRSHFAPDHDFRDRADQELTRHLLLPANRYNTSLQKTRLGSFSSSMRGPADPQTLNRPNHWYPEGNLSPKSASHSSNQTIFEPENQEKFRHLVDQEDQEEYRCEKCETRRIEREKQTQRIEQENPRLGCKKAIKMSDKPVQDMIGVTVLIIMALIYLLLTLVVVSLKYHH